MTAYIEQMKAREDTTSIRLNRSVFLAQEFDTCQRELDSSTNEPLADGGSSIGQI